MKRLGSALAALMSGFAGASASFVAAPPAWADERTRLFDIPAQSLPAALLEFARQAESGLVLPVAPLDGAMSAPVHGALDPQEALERMLEGTGFAGQVRRGAVQVRLAQAPPRSGRRRGATSPQAERAAPDDEIVVVGTNIRGSYPAAFPVDHYSADDIARTGAVRTEQFADVLTQNLGTRSQYGPGSTIAPNREGVNGIDLRGLGVGASLVLLNGRRLPLASEGQAVDLSLIPLSAIARVEVLTDGASANYGSDAIGGVVNFVVKSGVEGGEARIDFGGVTDGGLREGGLAQSFGHVWDAGEFFISASARQASALAREDREFSRRAGRGDLSPNDERYALIGGLSLDASPRLTLSGDLFMSHRHVKTEYEVPEAQVVLLNRADIDNHFATLSAAYDFNSALRGAVTVSRAARADDIRVDAVSAAPASFENRDTDYSSLDANAELEGRLGRMPGGSVRFSLGAGRTQERYSALASGQQAERSSAYAFAEALVPLVGEENGGPLMRRLELSLAARYTDYTDESGPATSLDFGDQLSPKFGLMWAPSDWLHLRGSYAQSFRAASLAELDPSRKLNSIVPAVLRGAQAVVLNVAGAPAHLRPETAETSTLGFDLMLPGEPRLRLGATYFNIDYVDSIAIPDPTSGAAAILDPDRFAQLFTATNTQDSVGEILSSTTNLFNLSGIDLSDPTAAAAQLVALPNFVVFDNRLRNLSDVIVNGFDLDVSAGVDSAWGVLSLAGRLTYILDYRERLSRGAPASSVVDTALRPVDLRAWASIGLARDSVEGSISVNYVDDYRNPYSLGDVRVESWTTWDVRLSLDFVRERGSAVFGVSVRNVLDEAPPYVQTSGSQGAALRAAVGFDPANANPLGRLVMLDLIKKW